MSRGCKFLVAIGGPGAVLFIDKDKEVGYNNCVKPWKGVRAVEGGGLENR